MRNAFNYDYYAINNWRKFIQKLKGLITINMHQMDNRLKFWLLVALAFPTIMIIFFGGLLLNSLNTISSVSPYLVYAGIVLFGFVDIIFTYSMFAMIQDRLRQSYMKIRNWTHKIKEGDLTTRLTFSKKSDLYYIAESFNTMADVMQDLLNEPFLLTEKGQSYRRLLDECFAKNNLEINPILEKYTAQLGEKGNVQL